MSEELGIDKLLRSTPRLAQILAVFARHGFIQTTHGEHRLPPPAEMREAFEELGVVFLKFGQVLALRRDLLPDAYVAEMEKLQDHLPPMAFSDARATIETELGAPLAELFASFNETPLAAATIAQVHEATLQNGRHVVVKVRRTGLDAMITEDTAALSYLAAKASPALRAICATLPPPSRGATNAQLAFDIYVHRVRFHIGAMLAALGGLDALVFTAGVGENSAPLREAVCAAFGFLGLELDAVKNAAKPMDEDIAARDSRVRVLVIQAQEDWAIAGECWKFAA